MKRRFIFLLLPLPPKLRNINSRIQTQSAIYFNASVKQEVGINSDLKNLYDKNIIKIELLLLHITFNY